MRPIEPLDEFFTKADLFEADAQARRDVSELSDRQLAILARYDAAQARQLAEQRAATDRVQVTAALRTKREGPLMTQTPAVPATGLTVAGLEALVDGLVPAIKRLITQALDAERLAREKSMTDLQHQIALLHQELLLEKRLRVVEQRTGVTTTDLTDADTKRLQ